LKEKRSIYDLNVARASNLSRALSEIRRRGETARVDLVTSLDLSPATVTTVISELIAAKLIEETPSTSSTSRGRPRIQLRLNPNAHHVAGAKLTDGLLTVAILDFCGEVLSSTTVDLPRGAIETSVMMDKLDSGLKAALREAGLKKSDLSALGLGVPGFVEVESGLCHWSPLISNTPINLRDLLAAKLTCPVFVDNDANLATMAELWFGHGREERDFLVVTVEHGVGLGIVLDGQVYRGSRGLGTEFGHTNGQRGCLEAYVADYALAREAGLAVGDVKPIDLLSLLAERAKAGHEVSASIYRRAGRMLGLGLANLINIFDPPLIVLSGDRIQNYDLLADEVERTVNASTLKADREPARFAVHRWGDQLWARGAGALALDGLMAQAAIIEPANEAIHQ